MMNKIFDQLVSTVCLMLGCYSASPSSAPVQNIMMGVFLSLALDVLINFHLVYGVNVMFAVVVEVVVVVVVVTNLFLRVSASL